LICRLCGENEKLIDAHIIPWALIKEIMPKDGKPLTVVQKDLHYTPPAPKGEYDPDILCNDCDKYLGNFEQISVEALRQVEFGEAILGKNNIILGRSIKIKDHTRFKLGFLSILWKASISKRMAYQTINLGPHEDKIKKMLLNKDAGKENDYSLFIRKYKPLKESGKYVFVNNLHKTIVTPPPKKRIGGVYYYEFPMLEYAIFIKVSQNAIPEALRPVSLREGESLIIFEREFEGSNQHIAIYRGVFQQQEYEKAYKLKRISKNNPQNL
jgi:hypothetical protein